MRIFQGPKLRRPPRPFSFRLKSSSGPAAAAILFTQFNHPALALSAFALLRLREGILVKPIEHGKREW